MKRSRIQFRRRAAHLTLSLGAAVLLGGVAHATAAAPAVEPLGLPAGTSAETATPTPTPTVPPPTSTNTRAPTFLLIGDGGDCSIDPTARTTLPASLWGAGFALWWLRRRRSI